MIPKSFQQSLAPNLGRTTKLIEHYINHVLSKRGLNLTKMQFILLHKLHEQNGACQNDLAFSSNRNKSSLTRAINVLEKKNYIARIPNNEDKRINQIFITKSGMEIINQSASIFEEIYNTIHKGINKEEVEQINKVLNKIRDNIYSKTHLNTSSNKNQ